MNFKLTKAKVIISIIVIIAWYVFLFFWIGSMTCECIVSFDCPSVFTFSLIPGDCYCGCPSLTTFSDLTEQLLGILTPGILTYVMWSFVQKKKKK